jgi:hypothetical protein
MLVCVLADGSWIPQADAASQQIYNARSGEEQAAAGLYRPLGGSSCWLVSVHTALCFAVAKPSRQTPTGG